MKRRKYGCKRKDATLILVAAVPHRDEHRFSGVGKGDIEWIKAHPHRAYLRRVKDGLDCCPDIPWADGCGPDAEAEPEPKWKAGELVKMTDDGDHFIVFKVNDQGGSHWQCIGLRDAAVGSCPPIHHIHPDRLTDPDPEILAAYNAGKAAGGAA